MIVISESGQHLRVACRRCDAHTLVRRDSVSRKSRRTCPVCGSVGKVRPKHTHDLRAVAGV